MSRFTFHNGKSIPSIGFGAGTAWFKRDAAASDAALNPALVDSIVTALSKGFRLGD